MTSSQTDHSSTSTELLEADRRLLWHPYSSFESSMPNRLVRDARGTRLTLQAPDGLGSHEVVDAMSSWWSAIHGYRHPDLDAALRSDDFAHVMFGGLTHEPAIRLAEQLIDLTPTDLQHVFLADSGSVSVEVALKMALQYQRGADRPQRTKILSLRGGYHGDTFGAMSVCDPSGGMHSMWNGTLAEQIFVPRPPAIGADDDALESWEQQVRSIASQHRQQLAAIICEPVLQGAGGMYVYDPACLRILRAVADELELVLIADEIATGFGRTGELFGTDHAGVVPDIMCVGKALTGGYLTLAATLCTMAVAKSIGASGVLMHGPTFMGNALACRLASASLTVLQQNNWRSQVWSISDRLRAGLEPLRRSPGVADVRVIGAVGVVQLDHPVDMAAATDAAVEAGVWLRPFRDLIYAMPPYVSSTDDIAIICSGMTAAVSASTASHLATSGGAS